MQKDRSQAPAGYYLGIDGGGSKTLAIIVDEQGRECGRGLGESSNYAGIGLSQAVAHIREAVSVARQAAGYSSQLPLRAAWIGLAGLDRRIDIETLEPHLRGLAEQVRLTNDAELPLCALPGAVGIALIAGTGSIALGRNQQGEIARSGGWGHTIGDEGSGFEMGRLALQAATRAADGRGPQTQLLPRILEYWNLAQPDAIIGEVYPELNTARIARLSTLVLAAAQAGDEVARQIVRAAVRELALAIQTVDRALAFGSRPLPLALAGGLLVHEKAFRLRILRRLRAQRPLGEVVIVEEPGLSAARAAIHLDVELSRSQPA